MIPAFPMDGGRVAAGRTERVGRPGPATMIAASIGRGLAVLFGLYSLIHGDFLQVVLAIFIYVVAGAELRQVLAEGRSGFPLDRTRTTTPTTSGSLRRGSSGSAAAKASGSSLRSWSHASHQAVVMADPDRRA